MPAARGTIESVTDVTAYLRRLGYREPARADLPTLFGLHRAWLRVVPYENLDIQLGRPPSLAPEALADKFVRRGRGGFCYEMNGALGLLLAAVGFAVRPVLGAVTSSARALADEWGNHMPLLVTVDGTEYLADVGLGDGFLDPLPLRVGTYRQGPLVYRLRREPDGVWRMVHHPAGTTGGFELRTEPRRLADFEPNCARQATDPASPFVRVLVVQQARSDHSATLRARTVSCQWPGGQDRWLLADRDEFAAALATEFGVPLADLGAAGLDRLWERACAQHETWLAERDQERVARR